MYLCASIVKLREAKVVLCEAANSNYWYKYKKKMEKRQIQKQHARVHAGTDPGESLAL